MLSTLLLIYLVHLGSANAGNEIVEIMPRCSNSPVGMTFTPVEGYVGRYNAELCTQNLTHRSLAPVEWELHLSFYETRDYCNASMSDTKKLKHGKTHSNNVEWVSVNHNCTANQTVCMSAQFDLIFSACYSIRTRFKDVPDQTNYKYKYVDVRNNNTEQQFHDNQATVDLMYSDDYMSVTWHTGIPPSAYSVTLYNGTDQTSAGEPLPNCTTTDKTTIKCYLSPDYGYYMIYLKHIAPWIGGIFYRQESVSQEIWRNKTNPIVDVGQRAARGWAGAAAGAGAALAALALALAALARARAAAQRRLKVLGTWLRHPTRGAEAGVAGVAGGSGAGAGGRRHVLVLAAREGAAAERARLALVAALRHVVDGQVYDIFSPEVIAMSAAAPAAWLRALLARPDVAVVLLQSPALDCLYAAHSADSEGGLKLVAPLLGRGGAGAGAGGVAARAPCCGDALLQYALRLVAERTSAHHDYHKYYFATISELPTEIFPCVVPYRRYALPGAAALLLRDVSAAPPPPRDVIDNFTRLLAEFVDYVKENPQYLMDELMVVDT